MNISCAATRARLTSHEFSGWLNADAPLNIPDMVVTLEVLKLSGWSNASANWNICDMVVTLEVSKLSGWLNANANVNIPDMSVTLEVFQLERSPLNSVIPKKST